MTEKDRDQFIEVLMALSGKETRSKDFPIYYQIDERNKEKSCYDGSTCHDSPRPNEFS